MLATVFLLFSQWYQSSLWWFLWL